MNVYSGRLKLLFLLGQAARRNAKTHSHTSINIGQPAPNHCLMPLSTLWLPDIYQKNRLDVPRERDLRSGVAYRAEKRVV